MQTEVFENERWTKNVQTKEFRHHAALRMIAGTSVLDLGCGDGLLLSEVDLPGMKRFGVDISPVAIEKLQTKGIDGTVVDLTGGVLPFEDRSFDTVVALDVLEHMFFPERLLKEALRVSKERVIIGVPNFNSLPARLSVLLGEVPENNRPKKGHCYWFNLSVLRSLVAQCGGKVVVIEVNTIWEHRLFVGPAMRAVARAFPSLFALSFVVEVGRTE